MHTNCSSACFADHLALAKDYHNRARPGPDSIGAGSTTFSLQDGNEHILRKQTTSVLLHSKPAFDLVDRLVPWRCLALSSVSEKLISFFNLCMRTEKAGTTHTAIFQSSLTHVVMIISVTHSHLFSQNNRVNSPIVPGKC